MTKEKTAKIAKIVLPILIIAMIGAIWVVKNKPDSNLDIAVQTADETAENNNSKDKEVSEKPTDKVANIVSGTDSTNDMKDKGITKDPKLENKESIQNTEKTDNATTKVTEENNNEKQTNLEVFAVEEKIDVQPQTETAKSTETPISTKKPEATNVDFDLVATSIDLEKLKAYGLPIIIDFGADSCIPCKEMAPVLKKLNAELRGKVIVKFVDVWKYKNAAANFPVEVIPTQFFFDKNGKPYVPSDPEKMQMQMYSAKGTGDHVYTAHQGGLTEQQIKAILTEMGSN